MAGRLAVDDSALRAATNPRRRRILQLVWDDELSSRQIASQFTDVTWQAISLNLKVLRDAGLVRERRDGTRRFYRADLDRLSPLESLLKSMWQRDREHLGDAIARNQREAP